MKRAQEEKEKSSEAHPLDIKYESLNCKLTKLDPKDPTYKVLDEYLKNTTVSWGGGPKIKNIFQMDRSGEDSRFSVRSVFKFLYDETFQLYYSQVLNLLFLVIVKSLVITTNWAPGLSNDRSTIKTKTQPRIRDPRLQLLLINSPIS